ncbi:MAG: sulfite exporter TauE/SafE family protein [Acidiferrobacterales bacterium]
MDLFILVAMGAIAGVLAGLLGIGGGIIIVPVLALVLSGQGVSPQVVMHISIGTSLATIVTTSLSSIRAHQKRKTIKWSVFRRITPGILVGALLGALIAEALAGNILRIAFACFMLLVALQMALSKQPPPHRQLPAKFGMGLAGLVIGTIASLMGVGGGSMSVPFLTWCNIAVRNAVATSAAIGLPIAVSGAAGFILMGWGSSDLPPWSAGYVNLPAYLGIVIASTAFAPVGAALAHRLPPMVLKRFFSAFLLLLAIRLFFN